MTEILFYHLQRQPLEKVLPTLLAKTLERGWTAVVEVGSAERLSALDDALWTYNDDGFLPHAPAAEADVSDPIVLTEGPGNPRNAPVRFLVDAAPIPQDAASYERIVLMFDGEDPEALAAARAQWTAAKGAGHAATYWQQDDAGRWNKKA